RSTDWWSMSMLSGRRRELRRRDCRQWTADDGFNRSPCATAASSSVRGVVRHYSIAELAVTEPSWVADYVAHVTPMVEARGGRYLARTPHVERIEGERAVPRLVLVIEWPSKADADAFYESDEYRPYREARIAGSVGEFLLVAGEDVNGVAQIG